MRKKIENTIATILIVAPIAALAAGMVFGIVAFMAAGATMG